MTKKQINNFWEYIADKYVYQESDEKYVYTKIRHELVKKDLFRDDIDKTSVEYLVLLLIFYGNDNYNCIRDVVEFCANAYDIGFEKGKEKTNDPHHQTD